jgi:hypothetical protein
MNTVASTLALLCIIFICTASGCDKNMCTRFCTPGNCPTFSCGNTKECVQGCLDRTCSAMTCDEKATSCNQFCNNCTTERMLCSSSICKQTCNADFCDMECASSVRTCQQICETGSTCKITCHNGTTDCQLSCNDRSNCTGLPEEPKTKGSCDERTGNCTKACTGDCEKTTLSCGDKFKECHLNCEDGCKMVCGKTVEKCVHTCVGEKPCTSVCHAASCQMIGKFHTEDSCDERTGNCTKTCMDKCEKTTLSCGDKFKECHLSCKDGCKMVCGKTAEKCVQTCIGEKPCTSVCHAASCQTIGKFHTSSSAVVCHLNNFMFVLFACIMILQLKNL